MKILKLEQYSKEEKFADRKWVGNKPVSKHFNVVAAAFPDCVLEVTEDNFPDWGSAYYKCGENGVLELWKQNWDTSG